MRRAIVGAVLAALASPAFADIAATLTGKTLVLSDASGRSTAYQLGEDGDMAFTASDGREGAGSWKVGPDGKLCLAPGSSAMCVSMAPDGPAKPSSRE